MLYLNTLFHFVLLSLSQHFSGLNSEEVDEEEEGESDTHHDNSHNNSQNNNSFSFKVSGEGANGETEVLQEQL